jgi:hypothetical protein
MHQSSSCMVRDMSSSSGSGYVGRRSEYDDQLHKLRKIWQEDINIQRQKESEQKKVESDKMVLERAKKLRISRLVAAEKMEATRLFREKMLEMYRARLVKNHFVNKQKVDRQLQKNMRFVADLEEESKTWITRENIDSKITAELFTKPSSTGLITSSSDHWKWQLVTHPFGVDRSPHEESDLAQAEAETGPVSEQMRRAEARSQVRLMLKDMLEEVVENGQQRANMKEYIDKFDDLLEGQLDMSDGQQGLGDLLPKRNKDEK